MHIGPYFTEPETIEKMRDFISKNNLVESGFHHEIYLITINEIRKILAQRHKVTIGCPITTGIFARIAAEAAAEQATAGEKSTTPYWRTLKAGGEINPKYPGGIEAQKKLLEEEGHKVIQMGKKYVVLEFERFLSASVRQWRTTADVAKRKRRVNGGTTGLPVGLHNLRNIFFLLGR